MADAGAESPPETRLRLLFINAGLPRLTTQFVVYNESGQYVRRIDMCWEQFKVGAEYDGEQHLTSRRQYVLDVQVNRCCTGSAGTSSMSSRKTEARTSSLRSTQL